MNSTTGLPGGPVRSKHPLAGVAPELAFAAGVLSLVVCFFGVVKLTATLIEAGVGWQLALVGSAAVGYAALFVVVEALFGWLFGPLSSMWVWLAPPVASSTARRCSRCGRLEPTRCPRCGEHDDEPELDVDEMIVDRQPALREPVAQASAQLLQEFERIFAHLEKAGGAPAVRGLV